MNGIDLTVFYDGGCPFCTREIEHYRRIAPTAAIMWIDVTDPYANLGAYGIDPIQALAEFHVLDRSGLLHKGAAGFLLLWKALPYYRWLAVGCEALHLPPILRWIYVRFARWHFHRRCRDGRCSQMI